MAFSSVHLYRMVSPLCIILLLSSIATKTIAWTTVSTPTHHPSRVGLSRQTTSTSLLQSTTESSSPAIIDETYYSPSTLSSIQNNVAAVDSTSQSSQSSPSSTKITLTRWLSAKVQDYPELRDMESLHLSIQMACKTISNLIHSSHGTVTSSTKKNNNNNLRDNSMKRLDQLSKNVLQNALRFTGRLRVVEAPRTNPTKFNNEEGVSEHQPGVTIAYALDQYGKVRILFVYLC